VFSTPFALMLWGNYPVDVTTAFVLGAEDTIRLGIAASLVAAITRRLSRRA
jgi:hypothetical protein